MKVINALYLEENEREKIIEFVEGKKWEISKWVKWEEIEEQNPIENLKNFTLEEDGCILIVYSNSIFDSRTLHENLLWFLFVKKIHFISIKEEINIPAFTFKIEDDDLLVRLLETDCSNFISEIKIIEDKVSEENFSDLPTS